MDLGNIVDKITGNADKIGIVVGAYGELARFAKEWRPYGVYDPLSAAVKIVESLVADPHMPNLDHLRMSLFSPNGAFKPAAFAAIAGYLLKEVDVAPQLTKIGNALMKAGIGAAEAALVIQFLVWSGAGHSSSGGGNLNQPSNTQVRGL